MLVAFAEVPITEVDVARPGAVGRDKCVWRARIAVHEHGLVDGRTDSQLDRATSDPNLEIDAAGTRVPFYVAILDPEREATELVVPDQLWFPPSSQDQDDLWNFSITEGVLLLRHLVHHVGILPEGTAFTKSRDRRQMDSGPLFPLLVLIDQYAIAIAGGE